MNKPDATQAFFTRSTSVAKVIERLIKATRISADAALYRLSHPSLARALHDAAQRGVRVRVILDSGKYEITAATRELLGKFNIPYRLMSGRRGRWAKMHHKFAVLDRRVALAGSYNWTLESEEQNFEDLLVLREHHQVHEFAEEFEALWATAAKSRRT
ncbi:MAG TPA: phospholipase D-like domain-containing protein [Terriglobia bacterium]|nr:phospholipase D-like domain-containing protein [Terriglobia bacterium]